MISFHIISKDLCCLYGHFDLSNLYIGSTDRARKHYFFKFNLKEASVSAYLASSGREFDKIRRALLCNLIDFSVRRW